MTTMKQHNGSEPSSTNPAAPIESSGVEDLIARLRDEGINEGRSEAGALVSAAQLEVAELLAKAKQQAAGIVATAKREADKVKAGGEDAVRLSMRDTILSLEGDLLKAFADRLRRLVKGALADPAFLQRVILEVAGRAAPKAKRAELLLSAEMVTLEDLQSKPEQAKPGTLMHFVLSLGGEMLREGMKFGVADDSEAGIRVKVVDENLQIDLTESAVSELLLTHMLPRYRALLRGAVVVETERAEAAALPQKQYKAR
jgi:V/A-type H+/Na+-transporting ATPase subunit E